MARNAGISGIAVAMAAAGAYLVYSGVKNVPLLEGARDILRGRTPEGRPSKVTPIGFTPEGSGSAGAGSAPAGAVTGAGGLNTAIVAEARRHLGKPYRWAAVGPSAFDCSGLVIYVLRTLGMKVIRHTTQTFLVWTGAVTIPRSQATAGDLACWNGHIGIFIDNKQMIHAPRSGDVVKIGPVDGVPKRGILTCRRVIDTRPGKVKAA